ncbi:MAG: DUF2236 domain-containing protein [Acidimicrobiaceae bacterium]|nr:DUF2236 domain-containing protein [Acidimicrobiaceae bacterium]
MPVRIGDEINGIGGLLAGTANVIMQLSWPPVGYGVLESTVDSGQVFRHPLKRTRTTLTYLAVAMFGSEGERQAFREAVNRSHAAVHSGPDSPVEYNAFDPDLQRWVAACLYWGSRDLRIRLRGPMDDATAEGFYREAARFATTLQVKPDQWPPDRLAFDAYWDAALSRVSIDGPVRAYLEDLMRLRFLPGPVQRLFGGWSQFVTTGFLPAPFREAMRLPWTGADERRFDRLVRSLAAFDRRAPGMVRRFPYNVLLWDMRARRRLGRPLV